MKESRARLVLFCPLIGMFLEFALVKSSHVSYFWKESKDSLQEVKSKQDKKKEEKKSSKRDEESSVNSDNIPADSREVVQKLKEVVNYSEQRSYKEVVKCNMNPDEAVNRLLSQDRLEQVKSKEDKNKETKDTSDCQGVGSSESSDQNHEFTIGSDSYVGLGGGNKFNSDETSNVQELCNHLDDSSITFGTLGPPSLNSDLTKRVPISSSEAVPSLSVPSSGLISVWGCGTSGQKTMDDVVKMSVDIAPVKDDCPLPEKRDVPISFIESPPLNQLRESARVKQLLESALVYNQNFQDGGSRLLCDKYNNKNGETYQVPKFSYEHNQSELRAMLLMFLQRLKRNIANDQRAHQMNSNAASNYHSSSNYDQREPTQGNQNKSSSATDFTFDNSQLFNPVMAPSEPSLQRQNFITFLNSMHPQYLASHLHLSMPTISSLGRRLPLSITEALMASNSESQMNRQAMTQQAYTREPDPQYLASPLNQSMPTEPSLGRRLPLSITEEMASISEQKMNGQAMNQQAYTMEPGPQYSAPPLHPSMDSISEPQMNGQAMNQQPYVRKTDPQYLAPPLHLPVASINEPQMNGQAMNQQAYTREQDPQYSASPLNHSMLSASSHGRRPSASEIEALVLSSINKPQVNGQAMNQQAYTREPNPQYSASPLNQSMPTASSLDRRPSASDIKFSFYQALVPTSINKRQMKQQMKRQAMNQQAYTSERDPQYSASPLNQSMPTAASHGRRPSASEIDALAMASISKPQMNGQATNHHYSQPTVPSGHYGTMMNYPNSQSTQNDTYNMSPSAIQQHGGNNNAYHLQPLVALLPQHINTDLSPSAVPFVPSAHRSTNGSTYNSAYGFGMLSDNNAANSRFGSDNVFSSLLNNQLPSFQHQNGNSNVWAPQGQNNSGSNYYGLFVGHQNQQSPSLRHSPQQEEQRYYESIHQESNRRDPSNQTQQQPRPSNNY